jgi:putative addiction module killer protein
MQVLRSAEFEVWYSSESAKIQSLVEARIFRIVNYDNLGDARHLGKGLAELRWKNGLRVYFSKLENRTVLLLYGGGKNDQKNDIKKARFLLEQHTYA